MRPTGPNPPGFPWVTVETLAGQGDRALRHRGRCDAGVGRRLEESKSRNGCGGCRGLVGFMRIHKAKVVDMSNKSVFTFLVWNRGYIIQGSCIVTSCGTWPACGGKTFFRSMALLRRWSNPYRKHSISQMASVWKQEYLLHTHRQTYCNCTRTRKFHNFLYIT